MKKITASLFSLVFLSSILFLQSCETGKSATSAKMLKFDLEKGKGYDYELVTSMDQEVMGQKMKMDMSAYYTMDVLEKEGDIKIVTMTYDRFKFNTDVAGMSINIDSDTPMQVGDTADDKQKALGMMNNMFSGIKGKQFTMKINSEGKVLEVAGIKEMMQSLVDSMNIGDEAKKQFSESFTKQLNDETVKSQFERILYIFPNKEVKVGDSWQKNTSLGGDMPAKYNSTYTVTDIEGDMVTLEEKSIIESTEEKMKMTGKVDGTLVVDSRTGLVVKVDQDMKMNITAGEGQSMEIKGVTKVKGKAN